MELFGSNIELRNPFVMKREAPVPGVPTSTNEQGPKVSGGSFEERIAYVRSPLAALTVSAVYRATELRAKTLAVMPVQYRKKDSIKGNFVEDRRGLGNRINYLLQVEPNPLMTASDMWQLVTINQLMTGNGFVYIERDEFEFPYRLWLVREGGYNVETGTYSSICYLSDTGWVVKTNVPRRDVMHFPNTFRWEKNGFWGISTIQFAIETLSLNKTLRQQALETAGKGGRVKLMIGESQSQNGGYQAISGGLYNKKEMDSYAEELQRKMYSGHDILAIRGLDKVQNISMTAAEMQAIEQTGMTDDDVARFWGTPRPLLMLDTNSHYNDYQNATMEYHTRTILPEKSGREKEIYRKIDRDPQGNFGSRDVHICEKPLLAMDPERQAKVDLLNLQTGANTINEIRAEHDRPSVEGGDTPMASANLMTLDALIAKSQAATELQPGNYTVKEPQTHNNDEKGN